MISVILFKMGKHRDFHLSLFQIVGASRDFTVGTKLTKNLRVYMVLGDAVSKLETFVWILNYMAGLQYHAIKNKYHNHSMN